MPSSAAYGKVETFIASSTAATQLKHARAANRVCSKLSFQFESLQQRPCTPSRCFGKCDSNSEKLGLLHHRKPKRIALGGVQTQDRPNPLRRNRLSCECHLK